MRKSTFWWVFAVGAGPMLLASFMYFTGVGVPQGRTHQGELIADGRSVNDWSLATVSGQPWQMPEQWQLMLTQPTGCTECEGWVEKLPNLHTALGKERDRVAWHQVLPVGAGDGLMIEDMSQLGAALWVVDPLGNLVLRYELTQEPQAVLDDLRKLLKFSKLG
jgi:hypothetical protein